MTTDKQKTIIAIKVLLDTCNSAKASISSNPPSLDADSPPLLATLRSDLLALCSFLHGLVTKLSLALKPSSPTYSACLAPLKEISERIAALSHCVNMFNPSEHGATLRRGTVSVAIDVITAVQALATTFLQIEDSGEISRSGNEYLMRTAAVHDVIELAHSSDGIPKDNLAAVRSHWLKDAGALEDGIREVGEMIETGTETDDDDDDGWNELGIEPNKPLTDEELKRTKKVLAVLRLCNLLHQKVITEILSTPLAKNSLLDDLAPFSPALLSACDELVSTLDSPQDVDSVRTELDALKVVIEGLQNCLSPLYNQPDSLTPLLAGISLDKTVPSNRRNPMEKWFNTCFDQIHKAIQLAAGPSNVGTHTIS